jgi:ABC-type siderophore export system fused ATPase/permease subunit
MKNYQPPPDFFWWIIAVITFLLTALKAYVGSLPIQSEKARITEEKRAKLKASLTNAKELPDTVKDAISKEKQKPTIALREKPITGEWDIVKTKDKK